MEQIPKLVYTKLGLTNASLEYRMMLDNMVMKIWATVLLTALCSNSGEASRTNFQVKRFELCNSTQGSMKFYGNISRENGKQYLSFNMSTPVAWDANVGAVVPILTKIVGNTFTELFVVREKNACKAAISYLGEFWYDIQRAAQFPPRVCPIPAGRYQAHHTLLDFRKMALQTFPFGTIRFLLNLVDNRNNKAVMGCLLVEVDNLPE